jgi:hypothetical protein
VAAQIQEIPIPGTGLAVSPHQSGMHFEVLNNRQLTPAAMLASVYQSLSGTNQSASDMSYRLHGELLVKGLPPVELNGMMSGTESNTGAVNAALFVNDRFSRLYSNSLEQPEITALKLHLEAIPERRTALLEGARVDQMQAHPGESIEIEATIHPYSADAKVVRIPVKLPDSLTPGQLRVVVSDSATADRMSNGPMNGQHALSLVDAIAQMNRMHENDKVYVTLLQHSAQAALDTQALPVVPLSMANVLEPLRSGQKMQLTGESAVEAGSAQTGYAVSGTQVLTVDVQ